MARLTPTSTVCALIPHFGCEAWLAGALESLLTQSHPPDAIVVIDDASADPPADIVAEYSDVTLLSAASNGGPYRLIQGVIDATDYDAYLFQDADDWSAPDRLQVLLAVAQDTGAELVGSHEIRVMVDQEDMVPARYPLDVNAALRAKPHSFPLLHPTSVVARELVQRIGGFATAMRFSGDAEFLRRAGHTARIVNADHFGYFRRKRAGSLTTAPDTALNSPWRRQVQAELAARARANAETAAAGRAPDLAPWRVADGARLHHVTGPRLGARRSQPVPRTERRRAPAHGRPTFVIGPPRAGQSLLSWALGQHPSLRTLPDSRWLARAAGDVAARAADDAVVCPDGYAPGLASALAALAAGPNNLRWVGSGPEVTDAALSLAELFPDAMFLFLTRDVEPCVAALQAKPTEGGNFHTRDLAYRRWIAATRMGLDVQAALGTARVLRIDHDDLIEQPEKTLRRCLEFLGVDFGAGCLRPFVGLEPEHGAVGHAGPLSPAIAEQVTEVAFRLAAPPDGEPEAEVHGRLELARRRRTVVGRGGSLVEKVRDLVDRSVPAGAIVVVVSRGDPRLVDLGDAIGWHYPQVDGGTYAGSYPADSATAIAHLQQLCQRGAEYLLIPASGFWWLSHYEGLRDHIDRHHGIVAFQDDTGVVYRLGGGPVRHADLSLRWTLPPDDEPSG